MKEKLNYLFSSLFHPFDSFYDIRFRNKGSVVLAVILGCAFGILKCVSYQYTGFIMNTNPIHSMNSLLIFIMTLFSILLFCLSNWSVTTLFNGKGTFLSILEVVCYSLLPLIVFDLIAVILSNVIIEGEVMLIYAFRGVGVVWFCFLVFTGLCTIHEYGVGKNIVALLMTVVAAVIIIFLMILFVSLEEKMFGFFGTLVMEAFRRMH